tara:strand:- start:217 stop:615 length:399 start_codon:yes stop_codon:yes gene_type:complete
MVQVSDHKGMDVTFGFNEEHVEMHDHQNDHHHDDHGEGLRNELNNHGYTLQENNNDALLESEEKREEVGSFVEERVEVDQYIRKGGKLEAEKEEEQEEENEEENEEEEDGDNEKEGGSDTKTKQPGQEQKEL